MKKTALKLQIIVMLVLAAVFFFAGVAEAVTIDGSFSQDGQLVFEFRTDSPIAPIANSFMAQDIGYDWTCDVGMLNRHITTQDSASTVGAITDENLDGNLDLLTASVATPYPGYYNSFTFIVGNTGSSDTVMPQPVFNWMGQPVALLDGVVTPLYDLNGNPVLEVRWKNNTGKTLEPGMEFQEGFDFHIISTPPPPDKPHESNGLTPGYWKNWRNHYTPEQFSALLAGTIAANIESADQIFADYDAGKNPLTILQAQLLATQLTLNLSKMPEMPNPDAAYLSASSEVVWTDVTVTVGDAVDQALTILANPSAYSRGKILAAKDLLDTINNLD